MRTRLSVLITVAAIAGLAGQQQEPVPGQATPAPEFRAGANLVRVDMFPTRDGRFVTDLRPDEVEVYEDGVRQRIDAFEYVSFGTGNADLARAVGPRDAARARVFMVFIDTHTIPLQNHADLRRTLLRFLDRLLLPTDIVGLMTPDMDPSAVVLGDRSHMISDLANDSRWQTRASSDRIDPKEYSWENCYGRDPRLSDMKRRRRAKVTLESLQGLVDWLGDLRQERKAVLLVSSGWYFPERSAERDEQVRSVAETETCARERRALGRINFDSLLNRLGKTANRANVSFYPVTPRRQGGFAPASAYRRRSTENVEAQLERLAETTDGLVDTRTRDFDGVLQRMIDDTSAYYLLGYQSTNQLDDNRYRLITVRVKRPGVKVRARTGYGGERTRPPTVVAAPTKPQVDPRVTAALDAVSRFDARAPMWLRAASWTSASANEQGAFWLVGEVGERDGKWAGATAEVTVLGADKQPVLTQTFDLTQSDEVFELRVPDGGLIPVGAYSVRVRMRASAASASDTHDAVRVQLTTLTSGLGEPMMWRRGPLVRDTFRLTADPRFRRTEQLRLEFATDVEDVPTARLLDRLGKPLQLTVAVGERVEPNGRWVTAAPPIIGLAPGDYAVEVTQRERVEVMAFKIVP